MMRDDATQRQVNAARPDRSTWLAANAGSGKTRVLTDRVARLLLDGVSPQHILCLTYTKAAATEMQNRLFRRLGAWAMLPDDALRAELAGLGVDDAVDAGRLRHARTLFARAIETPGGLKIQTIHSFCASLLRRFPLEAGVSPQFTEMEDRDAALLRARVIEDLAEGPDRGRARDVLARVALQYSGQTLEALTGAVVGHAEVLSRQPGRDALAAELGLPEGYDAGRVLAEVFLGSEMEDLAALATLARDGSVTDQKLAGKLAGIAAPDMDAQTVLEGCFLTGAGAKVPFSAKIGSVPTKGTRGKAPDLMDRIDALMSRVEQARDHRLALALLDKTVTLYDFAGLFLPAYARAKLLRGAMDFDDLILRARDLLTNPEVSAWVLFRLDGGIDHILVDEAQDTSPQQWQVIQALAREFTSGAGAREDRVRTIFVVGDKKQSIYSFQGADPSGFDRMRDDFAERLDALGRPLQRLALAHSFRSSPAILSLVDRVFEGRAEAGFSPEETHIAFHDSLPGRVDLWPLVEKVEAPDSGAWDDPVDLPGQRDHDVVLADRIARSIREMIDARTPLPLGGGRARPIHEGDILILVRRRRRLFHEIIRACKVQGLEIAGADRLRIGGELAVKDLTALLAFLATPDDELSLAAALKSPLFGWTEGMLFDLAHGRTGSLWRRLDQRTDHEDTRRMLRDLRDRADFLRPYELLERILTRHDGRRKLMARLGVEAQDGIDALLDQALQYERNEVPSLTGFLVWLQGDDPEVKRQMESAGSRIRVMTVHGSKGLEAPVVFLPETQARRDDLRGEIVAGDGVAWWKVSAAEAPARLRDLREAKLEKQREESDRLLYVAMTRAEKWLIVAAAGDLGKTGDTWYDRIGAAMRDLGAEERDVEGGTGLRLETGDWAGLTLTEDRVEPEPVPALPDWAQRRAPVAEGPVTTLSPSELGGAKALPGEAGLDEAAAKRRGRQVHLLLEHLPGVAESDFGERAARILGEGPDGAEGAELELLSGEARRVLAAPHLAPLFGPGALEEVAISASLDALGGARVHGTIDRLVVEADRVLAVDFKTNAVVPDPPADVPDGLLRQMGAYAAALSQVYPGRRVEVALLWTRTGTLMVLPQDLVMAALRATTAS